MELNDTINSVFTTEQRMAIFGSKMASLRRTYRQSDDPKRTPVDVAYSNMLKNVLGNLQEFPALDANEREQEKVGPAVSAWKRPISILFGPNARTCESPQSPGPSKLTARGVDLDAVDCIIKETKVKSAAAQSKEQKHQKMLEALTARLVDRKAEMQTQFATFKSHLDDVAESMMAKMNEIQEINQETQKQHDAKMTLTIWTLFEEQAKVGEESQKV